jgi:ABC-type sulfate transport system permease subunit
VSCFHLNKAKDTHLRVKRDQVNLAMTASPVIVGLVLITLFGKPSRSSVFTLLTNELVMF